MVREIVHVLCLTHYIVTVFQFCLNSVLVISIFYSYVRKYDYTTSPTSIMSEEVGNWVVLRWIVKYEVIYLFNLQVN